MKRKSITIKIIMDNDAFKGDPFLEITRILHEMADDIQEHGGPKFLNVYDINGDVCGSVTLIGF
jgi:hypothetical protein